MNNTGRALKMTSCYTARVITHRNRCFRRINLLVDMFCLKHHTFMKLKIPEDFLVISFLETCSSFSST